MTEKLFSLVSLGFLTVGFIVGVAGADKDGPKDLAHATDQLIHHVTLAKEAEEINRPQVIMIPTNDESQMVDDKSVKNPKVVVVPKTVKN
jgi:hypothetical protein